MQGIDENMERLYELIGKQLDNSISDLESSELQALLSNSSEYKGIFNQMKNLWGTALVPEQEQDFSVNVDAAWNKLDDKINRFDRSTSDESSSKNAVDPKNNVVPLNPTAKSTLPRVIWYSIAAVMLIGLTIFGVLKYTTGTNTDWLSESTGPDEVKMVQLADHSVIQLNENSSISFPPAFDSKTREVNLTGEAFFDVARDETKPFIIHNGVVDVRVLGTSFLIKQRDRDSTVEVLVESGKVQVESVEYQKETIILEKGEAAVFDMKISKMARQKFRQDDLFWKNKTLIFKKTDMEEVVNVLNNSYDCDIRFASETIKTCKLTATFKGQTLDEVLEIIGTTLTGIQVEKSESIYLLKGQNCK